MRNLRLALEGEDHKHSKEIRDIIDLAAKDKYLGDIVYKQPESRLRLLHYDDKIAGVCWPRRDSDGHYRTGPIFVKPEFRNKGVASDFVMSYFDGKKGRAWIEPSNYSSQAIYKKAGFKKSGKSYVSKADGETLYEYLK